MFPNDINLKQTAFVEFIEIISDVNDKLAMFVTSHDSKTMQAQPLSLATS